MRIDSRYIEMNNVNVGRVILGFRKGIELNWNRVVLGPFPLLYYSHN